jgi:hypothetical protein
VLRRDAGVVPRRAGCGILEITEKTAGTREVQGTFASQAWDWDRPAGTDGEKFVLVLVLVLGLGLGLGLVQG